MTDPLLTDRKPEDLFRHRRRRGQSGRRRVAGHRPRQNAGAGRRVGVGQKRHRHERHPPDSAPGRLAGGRITLHGARGRARRKFSPNCPNARCGSVRGGQDFDDLPGADDLAQSGLHRRLANHRGHPAASTGRPGRSPAAGHRNALQSAAFPSPSGGSAIIRTNSRAACDSGR